MKKYLFASTLLAASVAFAFASGDGSSGSPYTGEITDLDLSGPYADDTAYIQGVTGGFVGENKEFTTNVNIDGDGLIITSGSGDYTYTFSGKITGSGAWTLNVAQNYIFLGDMSEYTGNITFYYGSHTGSLTFGNGSTTTVEGSVSGTGRVVFAGAINYNYGSGQTVTVGNSYFKVGQLTFGGSADYVVTATTIDGYGGTTNGDGVPYVNSTSGNTITISTTGKVTFAAEDSMTGEHEGTITVAEGSTLEIATNCTLSFGYNDSKGGLFVYGTLEIAEGGTLTIQKSQYGSSNIANLVLNNGSTYSAYELGGTGGSPGTHIDTLELKGTGTSATLQTAYFSNDIHVTELVGTNATLILDANSTSDGISIFEFGSTTHEDGYVSTSQFTGAITFQESATGSRAATIVISEENVLAGAVITLGAENNSNESLSIGINAERVEIAGLISASGHTGGDIIYAGSLSVTGSAGTAGGNITSNSSTRNTLAINVADTGTYSFSGKVLNMLNLEKSGTGTQAFVFESGSSFDGSISVEAGTLALSGEAISSTGITVDSGATLTIGNTVTLATTEDVTSVSSKISGTVTITGTLNVGATTMNLDTTLGTSATGTVAFSEGAQLVLTDAFLASVADQESVTIIMANEITYGDTELSYLDDLNAFVSNVISWSENYDLSNWSYNSGTLSASVTYLPEPSMFGLMFGLGAIGLVATRRRRRIA